MRRGTLIRRRRSPLVAAMGPLTPAQPRRLRRPTSRPPAAPAEQRPQDESRQQHHGNDARNRRYDGLHAAEGTPHARTCQAERPSAWAR
jgi:hypothetical protein